MKEKTYVDDIDRNIYDFKNDDKDTYKLNAGLTPEIVEKLSKEKNDPAWMQNFRLESLQIYNNMKVPDWGPSIEGLNMDNIVTYVRPNTNMKAKWSEVPEDIKDTFEKLGIPQAERKSLAGVGAQYDSELVYHNVRQGKRQLIPQIKERMPEKYNNYYEPFVGGGAVTFELLPANALINDINKALINAYKQICNAPEAFLKAVSKLDTEMWEDGKEYYYSLREHYNDKLMKAEYDVELAALFVFINKHCFNGLYRVNGKGLFNVPYNNSRRTSVDEDVIMEISKYLQGVTIIDGDFEEACKGAKKGDFVFIDSPYAPLNPTSFESYTKEGFDIESHKRLAKLFDELTARGCYCMLTNHNTDLINELYGNKGYKIDVVSVKRMINSDASNRVGEEVIICNY